VGVVVVEEAVDGGREVGDGSEDVFPRTIVQICIVHLIRCSRAFVPSADRKLVVPP